MEIVLTAGNGRTLRLSNVRRAGDGKVDTFDATLSIPGAGSITKTVYEFGTDLPRLFRSIAADWRGFDGVKIFASLEGELWIEARHDGIGTVYCLVSIRHPGPPIWELSAELDFGAGAQLAAIADSVEHLLA